MCDLSTTLNPKRDAGQRLAGRLRVAMAEQGIRTYRQLGKESGVSPTTIDNWCYGATTPRAHHLWKVAARLNVSPGELERAYAGLPADEPPLIEVLTAVARDLHDLVELLRKQAAGDSLNGVATTKAPTTKVGAGE